MRLLIYCDEYPPAISGGIGSVTKIVAEELVKKGHTVVIVGAYEKNNFECISEINGVKIYRLYYFNFLKYVPFFLKKIIKVFLKKTYILSKIAKYDFIRIENSIEKIIDQEKIDCFELTDYIHLLTEVTESVPFKIFKVPTTMRIHGSISFLGINNGTIKKYQLKNDIAHFSRTQKQSAVSHFSKKFVVENFNLKEDLIDVIYNPIENTLIKTNPSFKRNGKTILFYGKIISSKGAFQVINAFNIIGKFYKDWDLVLIGSGEIDLAKSLIDPTLRNRVFFKGYVSREEVISMVDISTFCLIPSQFENFSMVALEILARGKALIYTRLTSGPEIITHGYNGILVNPYSVEEIVASVKSLIEDELLTNKLAINGYNRVNNFKVDLISLDLLNHYYSLNNNSLL